MSGQHAAKPLHRLESIIEFRQLSLQQVAHFATLCSAACGEQTFYLLPRESQILRLLDELHALHVLRCEQSKATR
jgi:hypothetical protein